MPFMEFILNPLNTFIKYSHRLKGTQLMTCVLIPSLFLSLLNRLSSIVKIFVLLGGNGIVKVRGNWLCASELF